MVRAGNLRIREKAKKYDLLAAMVLDYLDEPNGLTAMRIRDMLK